MQERVYQTEMHNVNDLKQRLLDVWAALDQSIIDSADAQRLNASRLVCKQKEAILNIFFN